MKYWKKLSHQQIKARIFEALDTNVDYFDEIILGVPASHLDSQVFHADSSFLRDAPYMSTLVHNPNHIGCHTNSESEHFFAGTQAIERELIELCAVDILKAEPNSCDGYVASGGTEANMQAIWVYRNYFMQEHHAKLSDICIITSEDAHYSMSKAANVLQVELHKMPINEHDRTLQADALRARIAKLQQSGKKYFIVVANMMTTMFGSVDDVNVYVEALEELGCTYKIHVDGAYGGFYYPFAQPENDLNFSNPNVTSVTLDAHKMAQAPYGTGIFLIRKGWIEYANTSDASYVEGEDYTLIGSRSGANAIAIWMILMNYGPYGWYEKTLILQKRADWLCEQLQENGIEFYRHPKSNIVTIRSAFVPEEIADEFGLVPDNHHHPAWYKIVIMEHVIIEKMQPLLEKLTAESNIEIGKG